MSRLFVANRGEIAVRILSAAKSIGLETVLGASAADRHGLGAELADRVVVLGPAVPARSYLDENLTVQAAKSTGCDALHPGYGFLSERASLARLCESEGIVFVGPRAETIDALGDKLNARKLAGASNVPLLPGTPALHSVDDACADAEEIGYPVVVKASAGGGGRGMFLADCADDIRGGFTRASEEARAAFGSGLMYMERFIRNARHVEVQVFGDGSGKVVHFGERDCSVQRRYQKLIEESPCGILPEGTRSRLHEAAVKLASDLAYRNAGTVEFLYDSDTDEFYFIEVNARIQVEHPVTELVSDADLVALQLKVALGEPLGLAQSEIELQGHAIECRINAEDPDHDFRPAPGDITRWNPPDGDGIRLDTYCRAGERVSPYYDSMIGKLIIRGADREDAIGRLDRALGVFEIGGLRTNLALQQFVVQHPDFRNNAISTRWLEQTGLPAFAERQQEPHHGAH
ncbi:MAG: acetyl-CoA carboxylase biotin carboxylase subunit [Gammaproteobacteria bacterium]|nr:acetyl-CoA carboxylase biotin carboxylase subunit [Gammaproteobacteria bacterium]